MLRDLLFVILLWMCQTISVAEAETCEDLIGHGMTCPMLPYVCSSKFAPLLCKRSCGFCASSSTTAAPADTSTYPPWTDTCMDHVVGVLTCPAIPNVCDDQYGQLFCRKTCAVCTPATTTTTTTTTLPTTTIAAASGPCDDLIGHGMTCPMLPYVCSSKFAPLLCRRSCRLCASSSTTAAPADTSTYPPWTDTCMDHVVGVLTCPAIPNVCDDQYGQLFCRKTCAVCTPATTTTTTTTLPPTTAAAVAETCKDLIGYGMTCPMLPYVCSSKFAPLLCRKSCQFCTSSSTTAAPADTSTYPPWTDTCMDHVVGVLTCPAIPNVCDDQYGQLFCRKTCAVCTPATTTTTTTTTPPSTTKTAGSSSSSAHHHHHPSHPHPTSKTTTTAMTTETCVDKLANGLSCVEVAQICAHPFGPVVCPRTCHVCEPNPNAVTSEPPSTSSPQQGSCADYVGKGLSCADLPDVCSDLYGQIICRRFCGICVAESTTPATTHHITPDVSGNTTLASFSPSQTTFTSTDVASHTSKSTIGVSTTTPALHWAKCMDHVGNGKSCGSFPGFCQDTMSSVLCPRFCGFCVPVMETGTFAPDTSTSSPADSCVDSVTNGLTCQDIPNLCNNLYGRLICPRSCNTCGQGPTTSSNPITTSSSPSSIPPWLTTVASPSGPCVDHVGLGLTCDGLPGACNDPLASIICKKTCGFCDCEDKIVGMTCKDLIVHYDRNPCSDQLGHQVCAKFCGFC